MKRLRSFFLAASAVIVAVAGGWTSAHAATARLLDGKLTLDVPEPFVPDKQRASNQSIGDYRGRVGVSDAWGTIARGTHGLQPGDLRKYMVRKEAEYTKGLSWLPQLRWLKRDIVKVDGREWADLRYIGHREGSKDPRDGLLYTRIFATSYEGQLLEILFTSNTDPNPATKDAIDRIIASVKLQK